MERRASGKLCSRAWELPRELGAARPPWDKGDPRRPPVERLGPCVLQEGPP